MGCCCPAGNLKSDDSEPKKKGKRNSKAKPVNVPDPVMIEYNHNSSE